MYSVPANFLSSFDKSRSLLKLSSPGLISSFFEILFTALISLRHFLLIRLRWGKGGIWSIYQSEDLSCIGERTHRKRLKKGEQICSQLSDVTIENST
ncbi:hypothetical protein NPIL_170141 [Nephila pilipes]|uniref:Uncharacterized protein n=1 Tax=Nephila pilipes TaxID=299642 RepID=A0A8X6NY45_NEPPI|nr:hypothetical protein NPIL_170141 [Nephila pilipes]